MSEDTRDLDLGEDIETLAGESPFSAEQQAQLKSALDPHMGSRMKTGGKKKINGQWQDEKASYLETNVVIDQANAIFGFGNWSYELLAEPTFEVDDPDLPHHSGVYYAMVRVSVRGCLPTVELGAQPMKIGFEQSGDPKKANGAQRRMAKQGAVSAGLKRGLRHFGNQFGNSLYSKDSEIHALIEQAEREDEQAQRRPAPAPQPARQPAPRPTPPPARTAAPPARPTPTPITDAPSFATQAAEGIAEAHEESVAALKERVRAAAREDGYTLEKWSQWRQLGATLDVGDPGADPATLTTGWCRLALNRLKASAVR